MQDTMQVDISGKMKKYMKPKIVELKINSKTKKNQRLV